MILVLQKPDMMERGWEGTTGAQLCSGEGSIGVAVESEGERSVYRLRSTARFL